MTIDILLPKGSGEHLTMHPDDKISVAVGYFNQEKRGLVVVVDDAERLLGVISTADVIRALGHYQEATLDTPVKTIMTPQVAICRISDTLETALQIMNDRNVRHAPVIDDDGNVRGVISIRDVLRAMLDASRLDLEQLRSYFLKTGGRY